MCCYRLAGDHQLRAVARATQRDFTSDTATGTGDENRFTAQVIHCQNSLHFLFRSPQLLRRKIIHHDDLAAQRVVAFQLQRLFRADEA